PPSLLEASDLVVGGCAIVKAAGADSSDGTIEPDPHRWLSSPARQRPGARHRHQEVPGPTGLPGRSARSSPSTRKTGCAPVGGYAGTTGQSWTASDAVDAPEGPRCS